MKEQLPRETSLSNCSFFSKRTANGNSASLFLGITRVCLPGLEIVLFISPEQGNFRFFSDVKREVFQSTSENLLNSGKWTGVFPLQMLQIA